MEKDIQEGSIGSLNLKQENGVGSLTEKLGPLKVGKYISLEGDLKVSLDEKLLIEDLIAKYGPSGILGDILKGLSAALGGSASPSA